MSWLIILLALFVVLLSIATSGFFAYQNYQLTHQPISILPTPTPLTSLEPTAEASDPTADWKIYSNTSIGFSFKYPGNWTERGSVSANDTTIIYIDSDEKIGTGPEPLQYYIWVTTVNKLPDTQYTKRLINNYTFYYEIYGEPSRDGATGYYITNDEKQYIGIFLTPFNINKTYAFPSQDKYEGIFTQILSTFKLTKQAPTLSPTPLVPANWITHTFNSYGLTMYTPNDWQSSITDFPESSSSLVKFWKKSSPNIVPIQVDIKSSWDNTGNAQTQPKNFMVDGSISAYRMDPPTKDQQALERYQTNVYFEHNSKVYVFECVHNWTQDYLDTCNTMLNTIKFAQ